MKKDCYIYLLLAWFFIFPIQAKKTAPLDTIQAETLSFDSTAYNNLKAQKKFDYYQQYVDKPSAWQNWKDEIYRWLRRHLKPHVTDEQLDRILFFLLLLTVVSIIFFLFFYKPSPFYFNRKQRGKHSLEEGIEGQDFDRLIRQALEVGEYTEAIRLNYLKVLKILNDKELISFNPNKTVNEYVYELKRTDIQSDFKSLSQLFIYYRYGKRKASLETFEHFRDLSYTIIRPFL